MLLSRVHDQSEIGAQRFYLNQLAEIGNFGLLTPQFHANYHYLPETKTLVLEVTSKELKGRGFKKPEKILYIAEPYACMRTVTEFCLKDDKITVSRKLFTN